MSAAWKPRIPQQRHNPGCNLGPRPSNFSVLIAACFDLKLIQLVSSRGLTTQAALANVDSSTKGFKLLFRTDFRHAIKFLSSQAPTASGSFTTAAIHNCWVQQTRHAGIIIFCPLLQQIFDIYDPVSHIAQSPSLPLVLTAWQVARPKEALTYVCLSVSTASDRPSLPRSGPLLYGQVRCPRHDFVNFLLRQFTGRIMSNMICSFKQPGRLVFKSTQLGPVPFGNSAVCLSDSHDAPFPMWHPMWLK